MKDDDILDEIVNIEYIGEHETIDIDVSDNHLFYANGILTHNSAMEEQDHEMYHIAGGISKINTADNVMTIYSSQSLKDSGQIRLQFIKTRSSSGVGKRVFLMYDQSCMRITDLEEDEGSSSKQSLSELGEKIKRKPKIENNIKVEENSKSSDNLTTTHTASIIKKGSELRNMLSVAKNLNKND